MATKKAAPARPAPFGHFDDAHREYVITRPDTPLPWINYLGVERYCGLISNTAGGYSFCQDARERRLLRYRYNNVPSDRPGRYIYIRDDATGDYWSGSWQPVLKDLGRYRYECRHGLSTTTLTTAYAGIRAETTYLVPLGETLEVWRMRLANTTRSLARNSSRTCAKRSAFAACRFRLFICRVTSSKMSSTRARFCFALSNRSSARRFFVLKRVTPAASSMMARRS